MVAVMSGASSGQGLFVQSQNRVLSIFSEAEHWPNWDSAKMPGVGSVIKRSSHVAARSTAAPFLYLSGKKSGSRSGNAAQHPAKPTIVFSSTSEYRLPALSVLAASIM